MNENVSKSRSKAFAVVIGVVLVLCVFIYLRIRPIVVAESHSPRPHGGYIRVVEIPTSFLDALFFRYNPNYRFEYHWPDDYLWSAATFSGESYIAHSASITWHSDSTATVSLDGYPYFKLRERLWHAIK